jgi:XTP/dITP diphosphohydrolase
MNDKKKSCEEFNRLLEIMDELRNKCPWDRKQTNDTLRKLTIEETFELADAIISGDNDGIRNELETLCLLLSFMQRSLRRTIFSPWRKS